MFELLKPVSDNMKGDQANVRVKTFGGKLRPGVEGFECVRTFRSVKFGPSKATDRN